MTRVFTAQHPTEAHLVEGLLRSGGIQAEVHGESLFSARGELPVTAATLPSVWVLDDGQVADALELLRHRATEVSAGASMPPGWTCSQCDETVEPQFTTCWKCGAAKPD
ncbi:MAG: DUF2007 domain-containing protein [Vicinamibacterales bacterium]